MASALKMVVALALGVVLFFPGTISDIPAVNLVWFVVKCALFMLFTLTVVKSPRGVCASNRLCPFPQVSRRAGPFEPYPGVDWLLTGGRS